jgi:hypothetical protein
MVFSPGAKLDPDQFEIAHLGPGSFVEHQMIPIDIDRSVVIRRSESNADFSVH